MEDSRSAVVEIEFRVTDPQYPLVSIPERTDCRASVHQIVPRGGDTYAIFYDVEGVAPERLVDIVNENEDFGARVVNSYADGGTIEVVVSNAEKYFVVALTDAGAIPREIRSADGVAHIVAEIPAMYDTCEVVEQFQSDHPTAELAACRQKNHAVPMFTRREFQGTLDELLTLRQREVLLSAYSQGYFEWPREKSGEEVANELDIAHSTFSQHIRAAERKVLSLLFSETA
jgi:predicted DNA binding protein